MRRPTRREDAGSTHVLESVIVASIMLSAVAFVATYESPPTSPSGATRALLKQSGDDALAILYDSPVVGSDFGTNQLSVYLASCLQGDCSALTATLNRSLPQGSSYALYVSNGVSTYPVYVTNEPPGEAVTSKRLLEPQWSYSFTGPSMGTVNNLTDPLVITTIPVFNSNVINAGGSPLKVIVRGIKHSDGSAYTLEAEYATVASALEDKGLVPAISMNFMINRTFYQQETGMAPLPAYVPGAYWDRYHETIYQDPACPCAGYPSGAFLDYRIHIEETAGVGIPAGTKLTVNMPRGWEARGPEDATWHTTRQATDWNSSYTSSDVVSELKVPISAPSVDYVFQAAYHGDLLTFYPFHAFLSNGANAEANLVVKADGYPSQTQTFAIPEVIASVPRPMGVDEPTTWSLAVNIPYNPAANVVASKSGLGTFKLESGLKDAQAHPGDAAMCAEGGLAEFGPSPTPELDPTAPGYVAGCTYGDTSVSYSNAIAVNTAIMIKNITIINEDGAPIFGDVVSGDLDEPGGEWSAHGSYLYWEAPPGGHSSTAQGPLNLTFTVRGSGAAGSKAPYQSISPPVDFETSRGRLTHQLSPGLYRNAFLPDQTTGEKYPVKLKGYSTGIGDVQHSMQHDYSSDPVYRSTALDGSNHYVDNALSPYHDSLYGSYVNVGSRNVAVGGQVVVTADVQSVLYALAQAGQSAGVNLTFYPPWTGERHTPIWRQENLDSGAAAADVTQLVMLDVTGDGIPDPVIGTNGGRIQAYDAVNGDRAQGSTFVAPVSTTHGSAATSAITTMTPITFPEGTFIAVGTDTQSDVYILDKDLDVVWSWVKPAQTALAMDTTVDVDHDGRHDILVTLSDSTTYALRAYAGDPTMHPIRRAGWTAPSAEYLYQGSGTPTALAGLDVVGLDGLPGFATSLVEKPGAGATVNRNAVNPLETVNLGLTLKSPAAGLELVDSTGKVSSTLWGPAMTVTRAMDTNHDGVTDVVAGSTSGFVYGVNGKRAAAPAQGFALVPAQRVVDGDVRDNAHAAMLMDDGGVYFTYDGWNVIQCVNCDPVQFYSNVNPALNAIAMNGEGSLFAVGDNNLVYRSADDPQGRSIMVPHPATSLVTLRLTLDAGQVANFRHDFSDVYFRWGTQEGWVIAGPTSSTQYTCDVIAELAPKCGEAYVAHTLDGGDSWQVLSFGDVDGNGLETATGGMVTGVLNAINFTTDDIGWIVGSHGTLLRTIDGGHSFRGIATQTDSDLQGIACSPVTHSTCLVVGKGSTARRMVDAFGPSPRFDVLDALVDPELSHDLLSVAMFDDLHWLVGGTNHLWETRDGGDRWTALPIAVHGAVTTPYRLGVNPDGSGFGFGGSDANGYLFELGAYQQASSIRTTDLTRSSPLPADAVVDIVNVSATITKAAGTSATIEVSGDGGAHWNATDDLGATSPTVVGDATDVHVVMPVDVHLANLTLAPPGKDVRVKLGFSTAPETAESTARVLSLAVSVAYHCTNGGCVGEHTRDYAIGTHDESYVDRDPATATATWDTTLGQVRNPLVSKFWTTDVHGYVTDIQVGGDVTGDGVDDLWVSTGSVIGSNNPDYVALSATNPDSVTGVDNRVYLLSGRDGRILAQTTTQAGPVTHLLVVDDANGPLHVYATVGPDPTSPTSSSGRILAFDAATLEPVPTNAGVVPETVSRGTNVPNALGSATIGGVERVFWVTDAPAQAPGSTHVAMSGAVFSMRLGDLMFWTARADERGTYVIQKVIPTSWLFGPYIVEVTVDWTDNVIDSSQGTPVARDVLQSARFYDYFTVTPPSSLQPASPLYDVHLVTWMNDWR